MTAIGVFDSAAREQLSALVDGELESHAVTQTCAHWRQSEASRGSWHAYQMIGDVLRSDDLASDPARDADFLRALRQRLAFEAVPIAAAAHDASEEDSTPVEASPVQTRHFGLGWRRTWLASSAVAAGFVVIGAGVLMLARFSNQTADRAQGDSMVQVLPTDASGSTAASRPLPGSDALTVVAGGELLRDARLDRYLAAHKQFAGTSALGVPSAYLRSATVSGSER